MGMGRQTDRLRTTPFDGPTRPRIIVEQPSFAKMPEVKKIETKAEFDELIKSDKLVVVDFYATWCGPCKAIAPKIEAMAKEEFADCIFCKVDVDVLEDVAAEQGVSAMPTFMLFKLAKKVAEVVGANEGKLREAVTNNK